MTPKSPQQDRSFGYFITGALSVGVLLLALTNPKAINIPMVTGFVLFAFIAAHLFPITYRPFRLAWFLLGAAASRICNPLVLGMLYFIILTPMSLVYGLTGKSHFKLRQSVDSNWEISDSQREINFQSQF